MVEEAPTVTVVIRARDEARTIGRVIDAVGEQTLAAEVVVVDSGSRDRTVAESARRGARIVHIAPADFSFGRSLNIGIASCTTDIAVALSAHAVPADRRWLEELTAPFADPDVAATYGRQQPAPGLDPFRARDIRTYWDGRAREDRPGDIRYSNSNAALRVAAWRRRAFDESLPANEDADWAAWAVGEGMRVVYVPAAAVLHSHADWPLRWYRRKLAEERVARRPVPGAGPVLLEAARRVKGDMREIAATPSRWWWAPASPVLRAAEVAAVLRASSGRG